MDGGDWFTSALVAAIGALTVAATVLIHFDGLRLLDRSIFRERRPPRRNEVAITVFALLGLHLLHVLLYGLVIWWVSHWAGAGRIDQGGDGSLLAALHLSSVSYSTVGLSDLAPTGAIRMLVAIESISGLLMITWSAGFSYHRLSRRLGADESGE